MKASLWGAFFHKGDNRMNRQYPVGKFEPNPNLTNEQRTQLINELAGFSSKLKKVVSELSTSKLDTPYRDGGWTRRQVIHHLADAHLNFYTRIKLALTEESPTIKPFDEQGWAELSDSQLPVDASLAIIDGVLTKVVAIFQSMADEAFAKTFIHPANGHAYSLNLALGIMVWHGNHHLAHVELN
jgi:uncharacterized damage-inducible protein DinB